MKGSKRGVFGAALLGLLAIACWAYALLTAGGLARQYLGVSVRLSETSVTQKALEKALERTDESELSCTAAWTRSAGKQTAASHLGGETSLRVVCVSGDMRQIEPMKLLSGAFPTQDDADGCLLDAASAWALFHSTDALGATVTLGDREYVVRGIAETYESVLMIRDDRASYENLEFAAQNPDGAKQSVETFLYRCGGADHSVIVQSGLIAPRVCSWGGFSGCRCGSRQPALDCCFFPARLENARPQARNVLCWAAGPRSPRSCASGWLRPRSGRSPGCRPNGRDFAFWGRLIDNWKTEMKTFGLMTQLPKEIELFSTVRRSARRRSSFPSFRAAGARRRFAANAGGSIARNEASKQEGSWEK
jgi:hypothetical protein